MARRQAAGRPRRGAKAPPPPVPASRKHTSVPAGELFDPAHPEAVGPLTVELLSSDAVAPTLGGPAVSAPEIVDLRGVRLGDLLIERRLGAGGMGEVWKARDMGLDIPVAVKVLPPRLARDPDYVIRFLREGRAIAKLEHPNIVRIFQAGRQEHQGQMLRLLVMEFVDGVDAQEATQTASGGRLAPRLAAEIVLGTANALRYAHSRGVIHRDIKPQNLLIPRGHMLGGPVVKVLDFGLALLRVDTAAAPEQRLTEAKVFIGTPQYIAPEQALGRHVDARADIYSLGVTLYELVTGHAPFRGESAYSIVRDHIEAPIPFPRESFNDLPPLFRKMIEGMCAKDPADRWPLAQVIEKLERFVGISGPSPQPSGTTPRVMPPTNLAPLGTSFVGREREVAQMERQIAEGARLITVMGPGGIGKTRFVREFGLRALGSFPGGVWFCDLTEARNELGICEGMGQGMGVPLMDDNPRGMIHNALRMRGRALVIMDNFEQVAAHAATTLATWLADAPDVVFIATSREPLHIAGEHGFSLDPLDAGDAATAPAVRLFCDRATEVRRNFRLDDNNREVVRRIVEELDGLPLAIELAAARVAVLSPQMILERLPQRFDILASRRRDASARQQTLRATIDWSWDLLSEAERLALSQCSVFRNGFFLESAEAVLDLSGIPEAPFALDVVESLVEKSLLRCYEPQGGTGESRYRMYESIREYAGRRMMDPKSVPGLTGPEAAEQLRLRHARHYVKFAEAWDARIHGPDGLNALNRLSLEVENLFAAQDGLESIDPQVSARAIIAISRALAIRGPWQPRQPRLERALTAIGQASLPLRVRLLCQLNATFRDRGGHLEGMESASREAMALARAAGPDAEELLMHALAAQGATLEAQGKAEWAVAAFHEAAAIARKLHDRTHQAAHLGSAAQLLTNLRRFDEASELFEQAIALHRETGDQWGLARNIGNRAFLLKGLEEFEAALVSCSEAEEVAKAFGDRRMVGVSILDRGDIHRMRGEYPQALACFVEAQLIFKALSDGSRLARAILQCGNVHLQSGNFDAAEECYLKAEGLSNQLNSRHILSIARRNLSMVYIEHGKPDKAIPLAEELVESERHDGAKWNLAAALNSLAIAYWLAGRVAEALAAAEESVAICRAMSAQRTLAGALVELAICRLAAAGKGARRAELLQAAIDAATECQELLEQLQIGTPESRIANAGISAKAHFELAREGAPRGTRTSHLQQALRLAREARAIYDSHPDCHAGLDASQRQAVTWIREILA